MIGPMLLDVGVENLFPYIKQAMNTNLILNPDEPYKRSNLGTSTWQMRIYRWTMYKTSISHRCRLE